jgi:hypothetical protein
VGQSDEANTSSFYPLGVVLVEWHGNRVGRGWTTSVPCETKPNRTTPFTPLQVHEWGQDPLQIRLSAQWILTDSLRLHAKKGGETTIMKFAKIVATAALAIAALGLGACASKAKPAPAPSTIGLSK